MFKVLKLSVTTNLQKIVNRKNATQECIESRHLFFIKMCDASIDAKEKKKGEKVFRTKEERKQALKQRRQERKANKQVGFSNEILNQTQYYFENGCRKVYPYFFGWNTTAKERWFVAFIHFPLDFNVVFFLLIF